MKYLVPIWTYKKGVLWDVEEEILLHFDPRFKRKKAPKPKWRVLLDAAYEWFEGREK
jgi:hypothetical protein